MVKRCKVVGCLRKHNSHGYCGMHVHHMKKYGEILDRTKYTPNEFKDYGESIGIIIYEGKQPYRPIAEAFVDKKDELFVRKYKWCLRKGYPATKYQDRVKDLHQLLNPKWGMTDHTDRDPLNNRRENLRKTNKSRNGFNTNRRSDNTSGVVGVRWLKKNKKWLSRIVVRGNEINLGSFDDFEKAVKVRRKAELKYFGEYK